MSDVYVRTLQRAVEIAGGQQQLAARLHVTPGQVTVWLTRAEEPPTDIFLAAVDIILEHEKALLARPKAGETAPRPAAKQPDK